MEEVLRPAQPVGVLRAPAVGAQRHRYIGEGGRQQQVPYPEPGADRAGDRLMAAVTAVLDRATAPREE
ncbi:hypothetical protein ACIOG8_30985 [Streptomyces erythrochromogenes]|uniref:hypothetical protein n=1 Tax=Streptomyces erythrochromogenes TaxID=285574 RepID=UPI0037FBF6B0